MRHRLSAADHHDIFRPSLLTRRGLGCLRPGRNLLGFHPGHQPDRPRLKMRRHHRQLQQMLHLLGDADWAAIALGRLGIPSMAKQIGAELLHDFVLLELVAEEVTHLMWRETNRAQR